MVAHRAAAVAILLAASTAGAAEVMATLTIRVHVVRSVGVRVEGGRAEVRRDADAAVLVPDGVAGRWAPASGPDAAPDGALVVLVDGAPTALRFADTSR